VLAAIAAGCVVNNQLNTAPPRNQVVAAEACAERVMKAFYPKAMFCDESFCASAVGRPASGSEAQESGPE
jgi:hypothetical protein